MAKSKTAIQLDNRNVIEESQIKRILLHGGRYAIVDAEDYEKLIKHKWACSHNSNISYACRHSERYKAYYMHREILNAPKGCHVDHINHNGLDNRKCNLRVCTASQNGGNRRAKRTPKTSKYKGVSWIKQANKWNAQIKCQNKAYNLGYYTNETDAAKAYNEAAIRFFGQFANINNLEAETTSQILPRNRDMQL